MSLEKKLIELETKYTGCFDLERRNLSPLDPRVNFGSSSMTGGDKFTKHGYGEFYSDVLTPFLGKPITLVECGVLTGVCN